MPEVPTQTLECRELSPELAAPLARFFDELRRGGDDLHFHPHPLTPTAAGELCAYTGSDVYTVVVCDSEVIAYGILRGWDAGFDVPSLGIAVVPRARGRGVGRLLMQHLHATAARRGARRVRLRVYPRNTPALGLYRSLGYTFDGELEDGQLVGFCELEEGC